MNITLYLFLLIAMVFSCKTTLPASDHSVSASDEKIIRCCAYSKSTGTWYKSKRCSRNDSACCEVSGLPSLSKTTTLGIVANSSCDQLPPSYLSSVSVCRGPTRFGEKAKGIGNVSDKLSQISKVAHVWIKTNNMEFGMGPQDWQDDKTKSVLDKMIDFATAKKIRQAVVVAWSDHSGFSDAEGARCERLYLCDQKCVETAPRETEDLGVYSLINQCHVATVKVLRKCGCLNHCTKMIAGLCTKRAFPELRGLN